jgi:hypothetical protein
MYKLGSFNIKPEVALALITQDLQDHGYTVIRSFDLRSAREALRDPAECACPYHGTSLCNCQYVVLLIHTQEAGEPISLIAHGHEDNTQLALVDAKKHTASDEQTFLPIQSIVTELIEYALLDS